MKMRKIKILKKGYKKGYKKYKNKKSIIKYRKYKLRDKNNKKLL